MEDGKIVWKWVRIPREIHEEIKEQARREKTAIWKVLMRAWSYWRSSVRNHHTNVEDVGKLAWYIFKLASSVGQFKENPSDRNFDWIVKNCQTIKKRLGVDASPIVLAASQYKKRQTGKNKMALNDATKMVIAQLISLVGGE